MKLVGTGLSPYAQRVLLAAQYKSISLELEAPEGGARGAAHLALNPMGKVPVLVDGSLVLPESEVILAYLDDRFPTPSIFPGDATQRAQVRLITRVQDIYGPTSFGAFMQNDKPGIEVALQKIDACLGYLEHVFSDAAFAAGDAFSAADCALIPFFCIYDVLQPGFGTGDRVQLHAKVGRWWARARASEPGVSARTMLDGAIEDLAASTAN